MHAEFQPFPKMARLSREAIITEKIDGTNAQLCIEQHDGTPDPLALIVKDGLAMYAGSRTRWITPQADNFGFAAWAKEHGEELLAIGPGRHFGEWWGSGIQRGYGLKDRRFSLFNVQRWCLHGQTPQRIQTGDPRQVKMQDVLPPCVGLVPLLWRGEFRTSSTLRALDILKERGSEAAPGFMDPEGIVVYHVAAGVGFKKTIKNDEGKGQQ